MSQYLFRHQTQEHGHGRSADRQERHETEDLQDRHRVRWDETETR